MDELIPGLPAADVCYESLASSTQRRKGEGKVLQLGTLVLDVNKTPVGDIVQAGRMGQEDAVRKAFQNDDGDGLLTMTVREPRCLLDIVQSTCFYVRLERRGKPVASSSHYVSSNSRAGGHDDGDY